MPKEAIHKNTINELKKNNIEVILKEGYEGWNIVNSRFFMIKEYLEKNKGKINRIMMADLTDVFVFGDIFSTFDENDLIMKNIENLILKMIKIVQFFLNKKRLLDG